MAQISAPYHLPVRSYGCRKKLIKMPDKFLTDHPEADPVLVVVGQRASELGRQLVLNNELLQPVIADHLLELCVYMGGGGGGGE